MLKSMIIEYIRVSYIQKKNLSALRKRQGGMLVWEQKLLAVSDMILRVIFDDVVSYS
jgi:hypothetical protein